MLNELSTIARVSGSKAGPELSNAVGTLRIALANNIFFIIIIMLTLISLIFQNIYTHFINRKREVAIEYINWISFFKRHYLSYGLNLIINGFVYYFASLTLSNYIVFENGAIRNSLFVLIVIETFCITLYTLYLERKFILSALMGEK